MKKVSELMKMVRAHKQKREQEMQENWQPFVDHNMYLLWQEIEAAASAGRQMCRLVVGGTEGHAELSWIADKMAATVRAYDSAYYCETTYDTIDRQYVVIVKWGEQNDECVCDNES